MILRTRARLFRQGQMKYARHGAKQQMKKNTNSSLDTFHTKKAEARSYVYGTRGRLVRPRTPPLPPPHGSKISLPPKKITKPLGKKSRLARIFIRILFQTAIQTATPLIRTSGFGSRLQAKVRRGRCFDPQVGTREANGPAAVPAVPAVPAAPADWA